MNCSLLAAASFCFNERLHCRLEVEELRSTVGTSVDEALGFLAPCIAGIVDLG